jgi:NAD(P)-dependent dehydrogenase (short-subunit alcohol dehydrogenase family)
VPVVAASHIWPAAKVVSRIARGAASPRRGGRWLGDDVRGIAGRLGRPEEIANLICYVCSKASSATNGAALRADGGIVTNPF